MWVRRSGAGAACGLASHGQGRGDAQCHLVHGRVRNASGGVRAEQAEHTGTAQFRVKTSMTRDDMEMGVRETFGLGEQRHVRLLAARHRAAPA